MVRIFLFIGVLVALAYWLTQKADGPDSVDVSGLARVVDGDTIWIGSTKIRLFGIDTPEAADPLGPTATAWMRARLKGQRVTCTKMDTDRYGRMVAICRAGGRDIAQEITQAGLARAYRRFSDDYIDEEQIAQSAGVGIWAEQVPVPVSASGACLIKGNVSNSGRIYHMPGDRDYAKTRITEARGEHWFCTEDDARAAGWRAASR